MEKKLVKEVNIEGFKGVASIYGVANYYEVEYKGKVEYLSKDIKLALAVAKVILFFYKNLAAGSLIFSEDIEMEEKWAKLTNLLSSESKNDENARGVCANIYSALSSAYQNSIDTEGEEQKYLPTKASVSNKDYLNFSIHQVVARVNPSEALNNFRRYQKTRNKFAEENPQFKLDIL